MKIWQDSLTFYSFFRFAQMTDVVSHRSATLMPPTFFAQTLAETAGTTTTRHEEKPMSRDHATEGSLQKGPQQLHPKFVEMAEKQQSPQINSSWNKAFLMEGSLQKGPQQLHPKYVEKSEKQQQPQINSSWNKAFLKKLPRYYPLERTNRSIKLEECNFEKLQSRLADSFRVMSMQAKFFDKRVRVCCLSTDDRLREASTLNNFCPFQASAALLTPENVELYLALWESDNGKEVIVEVQRRRGDALIFLQYAHHILDAASGTFDPADFFHDECSLLYLQSAETKLKMELSRVARENKGTEKESVVALEIVYNLLKRNCRDARRLGMESVCILANARKTCLSATILTSRALLLGDQSITSQGIASQGLHGILLGIIQKRSMGQDEVNMGEFAVEDDENFFADDDDLLQKYSPEYKEEMSLLFNLALDALAHALEVATSFELVCPSDDLSYSPNLVVDTFLVHARQSTDIDMLTTLLETVQRAHVKPHNAWLACKCLRYICAASPDAARRLINLGGMQLLGQAFDVGVASHAKLESECRLLQGRAS
jgi:hypothetical protein